MTRKIIKIGSSSGITLSKEVLSGLGLKVGDEVDIEIDKKNNTLQVKPFRDLSEEDKKVAKLTSNFIERYRDALDKLAK